MDINQKTPSQVMQETVEREVRTLIGDLHIQCIQLRTMLALAQQAEQANDAGKVRTPPPAASKANGTREVHS